MWCCINEMIRDYFHSELEVLVLQSAQSRAVAADDQRQELVLVLQAQRNVQRLLQDVPRVHYHVKKVVIEPVLLLQLTLLALFEFHLELHQRFLRVCKRLVYLGCLPPQILPVAVLSVQVVRDAFPDPLQHPGRVLDLPLDDSEIIPYDGVLVLAEAALSLVFHFKKHLALLRVVVVLVVAVRHEIMMESTIRHLRM